MSSDKDFLTYNQQMRKLRDKKKINCEGTKDKSILVKTGYFNLINGYKTPFICGVDSVTGEHIYLPNTFIDILNNSKTPVKHSICKLYDMTDSNGHYDVKLLIGSLHWLRKVRNSCAHNERIYCIKQSQYRRSNNGRIFERYFRLMRPAYSRESDKKIMDLLVYMKYYLTDKEFKDMITVIQKMLETLRNSVTQNAFDNIRGQMGIKKLSDLEELKKFPKNSISYNKFDTY